MQLHLSALQLQLAAWRWSRSRCSRSPRSRQAARVSNPRTMLAPTGRRISRSCPTRRARSKRCARSVRPRQLALCSRSNCKIVFSSAQLTAVNANVNVHAGDGCGGRGGECRSSARCSCCSAHARAAGWLRARSAGMLMRVHTLLCGVLVTPLSCSMTCMWEAWPKWLRAPWRATVLDMTAWSFALARPGKSHMCISALTHIRYCVNMCAASKNEFNIKHREPLREALRKHDRSRRAAAAAAAGTAALMTTLPLLRMRRVPHLMSRSVVSSGLLC